MDGRRLGALISCLKYAKTKGISLFQPNEANVEGLSVKDVKTGVGLSNCVVHEEINDISETSVLSSQAATDMPKNHLLEEKLSQFPVCRNNLPRKILKNALCHSEEQVCEFIFRSKNLLLICIRLCLFLVID